MPNIAWKALKHPVKDGTVILFIVGAGELTVQLDMDAESAYQLGQELIQSAWDAGYDGKVG